MKINPGNARGLLVPQGDRPFSFVVYSSEIRDFGFFTNFNIVRKELISQIGKIGFKRMKIGLKLFCNSFQTFTMFLLQSLVSFPFALAPSPWWNSSRRLPKPYLASAGIGLSCFVSVPPL